MNKKAAIPIGIKIEAMLALMLAFALMVCLWAPVLAEQSAEAKDMRLEATEGTVTLKNSSGKSLSVREGMKLYSGYTLKTSAKSYAYVTLDSSKVVKLDANSEVEVRKDGSKLELLVSAGELFFNVTSPLADDETMNIRTSTMVTGIRGTSGYVSSGADGVSSISVLDGSVTAIVIGGTASAQVSAGTSGSVVGGVNAIVSDTLTESGIPGFVAVEIAMMKASSSASSRTLGWTSARSSPARTPSSLQTSSRPLRARPATARAALSQCPTTAAIYPPCLRSPASFRQ